MKQNLRLLLLTLLCAVLTGAWAGLTSLHYDPVTESTTTGTINFGSGNGATAINGAEVTGYDDQDNEWTITTQGTTSFTQNAAYSQVGSSSKPATSITFTTTLPESQNITAFSAKFGGFSGTAGDVTLSVDGVEVGTGSLNGTSDVTISSTSTAEGTELTVTVTNIAKGVKCYSISYSYGDDIPVPPTSEDPITTKFYKVNNTNMLVAGNEYILVSVDKEKAMAEVHSSNNYRVGEGIEINADKTIEVDEKDFAVLSLGGSKDAYTFLASDNGEYLALNSDGNYLHSTDDATTTSAQWTISSDFRVQNNKYTDRYIECNNNDSRFAAYKTSQSKAYLYVKEGYQIGKSDPEVYFEKESVVFSIDESEAENILHKPDDLQNLTVESTRPDITYNIETGKVQMQWEGGEAVITVSWPEDEHYYAGEVSFSVKIYNPYNDYFNVSGLKELGDGAFTYNWWLNNARVLFTKGKYTVVADNTGGILIYNTNADDLKTPFHQYDVLNESYKARFTLYNGVPEATEFKSIYEFTAGDPIEPTAFAPTDATQDNIMRYIYKMSEVTLSGSGKTYTATLSDNTTFKVYNYFGVDLTAPTAGKKYNVIGVLGYYQKDNKGDGEYQFWPIDDFEKAEDKAYQLTITDVENATITATDEEGTTIASGDQVPEGTKVNLSISVVDPYQVESVSVTDAGGNAVTVNKSGTTWSFTMPSSAATVTCTVIEVEPSNEEWVLTDLADLTKDDIFVIVGDNGTTYAMSNDQGTSKGPQAIEVTISDDKVISKVEDKIKWTVSGNATSGYTFYPNGNTEKWLYTTNSNNGVRVGTNTAKVFTIKDGYLFNTTTSRYIGIYVSGTTQDWRCYTSITGTSNIAGQTFAFYKLVKPESITVDISAVGYATLYYSDKDLVIPAGVKAKVYNLIVINTPPSDDPAPLMNVKRSTEASLEEEIIEDGYIPAGTGVVLEAINKKEEPQTFEFLVTDLTDPAEYPDNVLYGSDENANTDDIVPGEYLYYMLSTDKNGDNVGFYWGDKKGGAFETAAHKAFLAIPKSINLNASSYVFEDLTGIHAITNDSVQNAEGVYTLSGMRIDGKQLPKGIYIVNGKKVVIK